MDGGNVRVLPQRPDTPRWLELPPHANLRVAPVRRILEKRSEAVYWPNKSDTRMV